LPATGIDWLLFLCTSIGYGNTGQQYQYENTGKNVRDALNHRDPD